MIELYPNAKYQPADRSNYSKVGRVAYKLVVIHITSGRANAQPVADMWSEPNHKSSAHFVIGQDGTTIQAVKLSDCAWHAHNANSIGVGIEHSAREPGELSHDDPGLPVSEVQYEASAKLTAWLLHQMGLPANRQTVVGHCEIDTVTTHTGCPNSIWDWQHYMDLVVAEAAKLPPSC